ncbi:MAG: selenoneine biosynthesis selenosugar synthase SenB, partial [Verrucomicrobiales bacterium]
MVEQLGHEVFVSGNYLAEPVDWLIGLHAVKSAAAVSECRRLYPETKIALVLTGTDIYPEPSGEAMATMRLADRLIGLQPAVADQVPEEFHPKLRVIVQASAAAGPA